MSTRRYSLRTQEAYVRTAHWLLALATAVGEGVRRLLPTRGISYHAANAAAATTEPEPAAAFVIGAPSGLSVTETHDTRVVLSWPAVAGAAGYRVERSPNLLTPYEVVGQPASNGFLDTGLTRGHTYLYRVRALDTAGAQSAPSPVAMATAIDFEDPELFAGVTRVKAAHVNDLRLAVAGVRSAALLSTSWQGEIRSGDPVMAGHVRELRSKLDEALAALGLPVSDYFDSQLNGSPNGTPIRKTHFEQLRERSTRGAGVTGSGLSAYDFASARLDPSNRTGGGGVDLYSRNFNWSLPLVSLPGRAGLDLGLALSYNSLVWTRSGNYVLFDGDWGWPAPGFRLGFPIVQGKFFDTQAQKSAYMMVTPSGARVSLRQTTTPGFYEAADSSYLQLKEEQDGSLTVRPTDGTQMTFKVQGGVYKCEKLKDRNGNFITVAYDTYGRLDTVTDTLGRLIDFDYYADGYLKEITQTWHREVESGGTTQTVTETHRWAEFEYDDVAARTNFSDPNSPNLTVFGPTGGRTFRALRKVTLADDSSYTFDYTSWGQVYKVESHAPNGGLLNRVTLDLPLDEAQPQTDCPRPTGRRDWAAYANGDADGVPAQPEELVTSYEVADGATWANPENGQTQTGRLGRMTSPDGTTYKEYAHASGWDAGLSRLAEVWSGGKKKKWTSTAWTQDDEALPYLLNPRVGETNIYDSNEDGSLHARRRTTVSYSFWGLPEDVSEYDALGTTVLRRTHTEYTAASVDGDGAYVLRRIIGLPEKREVYGRENEQEKLLSKVTFEYDLAGEYLFDAGEVSQHDPAYGAGFTLRGNVCRVRRWDATDPLNQSKSHASEAGYNTQGSTRFTRDALGHTTSMAYADSDGGARLAYPTAVTDPDGFTASTSYNYDMGAVTKTETPQPHGADAKPVVTRLYDAAGRLLKVSAGPGGTYTRWEYGASGLFSKQWTQVDAAQPETFTLSVTDGAGRAVGVLREHPGGATGYAASRVEYDPVNRVVRRYNPAEVSVGGDMSDARAWVPAGPDVVPAGQEWPHTTTEYDWKGRVRREVNADGSDRLTEYGGCGCAGGEVVTEMGELVPTNEPAPAPAFARRTQRFSHDPLGRPVKTEVLNWDGTVYATTTINFDALDRERVVRWYQGTEQSGVYQEATKDYDGYGRLEKTHAPGQDAGRYTKYLYNADDTPESMTDARGVKTVYGYNNNRHLVSSVSYDLSDLSENQIEDQHIQANAQATAGTTFQYDAAGNRSGMTDGVGSMSYTYDALSRLRTETRQFTGLSASYTLTYAYNLAGQVESVKDSSTSSSWQGSEILYGYSMVGGVTGVGVKNGGTEQPLASDIEYRAWGAVKSMAYGNGAQLSAQYDGRMNLTRYELGNVHIGGSQAVVTLGSESQYYADGRVSYARDLQDGNFDRAYQYDQAGRLKEAYSGREARGLAPLYIPDNPLRQSYTYDAWDNLKRVGRTWTNGYGDEPTYHNNRRDDSDYDADGRETFGGTYHVTTQERYDPAGRHAWHFEETVLSEPNEDVNPEAVTEQDTIELTYGGDHLAGKRVETRQTSGAPQAQATTLYYLRSSVLGGRVMAEIDSTGGKTKGEVYLGGAELAEQQFGGAGGGSVVWKHHDLARGSLLESVATGDVTRRELDPLGQEVGTSDPYAAYGGSYGRMVGTDSLYAETGNPFNPANGCSLDGIGVSCNFAMQALGSGAAMLDTITTVNIKHKSGRMETYSGHAGLPAGYDVRFTGAAAQVAASAFGLYSEGGFGTAVFMAILWGRLAGGTGADASGGGAAYSFAPQDTVTGKEYTLPYTFVADLISANNQSKIPNSVILCQTYKESSAKGFSSGSGRHRRWYAPPVGTFYNATQGSVSHRGLMQVGPAEAKLGGLGNGLGKGLNDDQLQSLNPDYINNIWDPAANIRAGTGYLKYLMEHYGKDAKGALTSYGPPGETTYASSILDCAARVEAGDTLGGLGLLNK